jgi:hypothetical protein
MFKSSDGGLLGAIKRKMGLHRAVPAKESAPTPPPAADKVSPPYHAKIIYSHTADSAKAEPTLEDFVKQMSS